LGEQYSPKGDDKDNMEEEKPSEEEVKQDGKDNVEELSLKSLKNQDNGEGDNNPNNGEEDGHGGAKKQNDEEKNQDDEAKNQDDGVRDGSLKKKDAIEFGMQLRRGKVHEVRCISRWSRLFGLKL